MQISCRRNVKLGNDVVIRDFTNLYECEIGDGSRIGTFVEVQRGVTIGKNCKIQSHAYICEGVTIEDGCFIGPGVLFTNDRYPRATREDGTPQTMEDWHLERTVVKRGASIGTGAIIIPGVVIGEGALVGAGSVVTHNVPPFTIVAGNPARVLRTISSGRNVMSKNTAPQYTGSVR